MHSNRLKESRMFRQLVSSTRLNMSATLLNDSKFPFVRTFYTLIITLGVLSLELFS